MSFALPPLRRSVIGLLIGACLLGATFCSAPVHAAKEPAITAAEAPIFREAAKLYKAGKHAQAVERLSASLRGSRPHPYAFTVAGLAELGRERPKAAIEIFERAVSLYPRHAGLLRNRSVALLSADRPLDAAKSFRLAAEVAETRREKRELTLMAAQSFYRAERHRDCIVEAQKVVERNAPLQKGVRVLDASSEQALRLTAGAYTALRDWSKAEKTFGELLAARPWDAGLWQAQAAVRMRAKDNKDAASALETASRLHAERSPAADAALRSLPGLYRGLSAPRLTLSALERREAQALSRTKPDAEAPQDSKGKEAGAIADSPFEGSEAIRHLALRYDAERKAGRPEAALATLRAIDALRPHPVLKRLQGDLLVRLQRPDEAQQAYRAGSGCPTHACTQNAYLAALLDWEAGRLDAAEAGFQALSGDAEIERRRTQALAALSAMARLREEIDLGLPEDDAGFTAHPEKSL